MVYNLNGKATAGEAVGRNMEFWTIKSSLDIRPTGVTSTRAEMGITVFPATVFGQTFANSGAYDAAYDAQKRFDAIVRTISLRVQPIIVGAVVQATEALPVAGLPVLGAGPGTAATYTLRFATDYAAAWDNVEQSIADILNGQVSFVFTTPTTGNNVSVTKAEVL
jgi:hypothetical protein